MKKPVYYVLLVVLLLVFCVSAFLVVNYFVEGKKQADRFDDLSQLASNPPTTEPTQATIPTSQATTPSTDATTEPAEPTEPTMIPGYEAVYNENPDVVGWIKIPGTVINYPVMHTPNNRDYYLKRDFEGNYSEWGCLYIREECSVTEPSDNITIYGHCMRDGSMFAALHNYYGAENKQYWQENQLIYFDTLNEYHVYEIFAVFRTSANMGEGFQYHLMVDAEDEADFNEFIATCKEMSFYETGITPVYGDKIICLSTCEYELDNGRLVVCARRVY